MAVEYACLQQTSIAFNSLGALITILLATRGVDVGGRPSIFFFEVTMAKIVLSSLWALVHLLSSLVADSPTTQIGKDLLTANVLLDGLYAVVHIAQLTFHRYWCVGVGWQQLVRRDALRHTSHWLLYSSVVTVATTSLGNSLLYHSSSEDGYVLNIVLQILSPCTTMGLFLLQRSQIHRGYVWFWLCCSALATLVIMTAGLVLMHSIYNLPFWSESRYAYPGQVCQWAFIFMVCFWLHRDDRPYAGPGCAVDSSTCARNPHEPVVNASSASGSTSAWHATVPAAPPSSASWQPTMLLPGTIEEPGEFGALTSPRTDSRRESSNDNAVHVQHSTRVDMTPTPGALENENVVAPLEVDSMALGRDISHNGGWASATQSNAAIAVGGGAATIVPALHPPQLGDDSTFDAAAAANESLMQVHKLAISLSGWVLFASFGMIVSDTLVAVSFPSLPRCGQVNLFTSDWSYVVRSISDILH